MSENNETFVVGWFTTTPDDFRKMLDLYSLDEIQVLIESGTIPVKLTKLLRPYFAQRAQDEMNA